MSPEILVVVLVVVVIAVVVPVAIVLVNRSERRPGGLEGPAPSVPPPPPAQSGWPGQQPPSPQ